MDEDLKEYEYKITEGPRKNWDGEPNLKEEGWEEYKEWERFDFHEERYWRRLKEFQPSCKDLVNLESSNYKPTRAKQIEYWIDYIIWKNGEEYFFHILSKLGVSRFNFELKKAIHKPKDKGDI